MQDEDYISLFYFEYEDIMLKTNESLWEFHESSSKIIGIARPSIYMYDVTVGSDQIFMSCGEEGTGNNIIKIVS